MKQLWGIQGVMKLHCYWIVIVDSAENYTERYREEKWRMKMKAQRVHLCLVITHH
jgi:hypothetical protein